MEDFDRDFDCSGRSAKMSTVVPAPSRSAAGRLQQPQGPSAESSGQVVYQRGPLAQLPDEHASRRERFAELDNLQPGWQVELRSRGEGGAVDAIFYSPGGKLIYLEGGLEGKKRVGPMTVKCSTK